MTESTVKERLNDNRTLAGTWSMNCNKRKLVIALWNWRFVVNKLSIVATGCLLLVGGCLDAKDVRIAAWNLEHLNANGDEGCVTRSQEDFDNITSTVDRLQFDVVAFQEVKDEAAARRVFAEDQWEIEMSSRPPMQVERECWGLPGRYLRHLATGFAIRKGISYRRNSDFEDLGLGDDFQRWGTDITLVGDTEVRLLSVHLRSGCWGTTQDIDASRNDTCLTLRKQIEKLAEWRDERFAEKTPFLILGDFNRRLAVTSDWAWSLLSSTENPLHLVTSSIATKCDQRYSELIDHIVADTTMGSLVAPKSTTEGPRVGEHPDHCAVSTLLQL